MRLGRDINYVVHKMTYGKLGKKLRALKDRANGFTSLEERLHSANQERLEFEMLLTELSAAFVKISTEEIDEKVKAALGRIGNILGFDRTTYWQFNKESGIPEIAFSWADQDFDPLANIIPQEHFPWLTQRIAAQRTIVTFSGLDELPKEAVIDKKTLDKAGIKAAIVIPFSVRGTFSGAISFSNFSKSEIPLTDDHIQRLRLLGVIIFNALRRKQTDTELKNALSQIRKLKDIVQKENIILVEELKAVRKHDEIIGESDAIQTVFNNIEQVAETDSTVLILGETGTGKELVARAIHKASARRRRPLVSVNCAALPAPLMESELFGREKGAYTDAISRQNGRFETADGSTLFLDEIGELSLELQAKLLRALQRGQFERLGSLKTISVNVRLIAATNQDLKKNIQAGKFRQDLYYRLNIFPIRIPPLRDRPEDIPPLLWTFVSKFNEAMGKRIETVSLKSIEALQRYSWPGNVRELRNVIERAMITSTGRTLTIDGPRNSNGRAYFERTFKESERQYITDILKKTSWRIRGGNGAAELLGLNPSTLYSRMKKLGIQRPN